MTDVLDTPLAPGEVFTAVYTRADHPVVITVRTPEAARSWAKWVAPVELDWHVSKAPKRPFGG